jgi:Bcr/CflA subfamily drug resistance transporter
MPAPDPRTPPRLSTLVLLVGVSTVSLNLFVPSLPHIAADFRVDYALANLAIGGYLAVTAFLQLVLGPLSDRFGRRPVLLACLAVFTAASLGCLLATDFRVFLACRLVQGAVIAGSALSPAIVRDTTPERRAASLIGYISMAMAIAPMTGPLLGGVLDELFGWRAGFATLALLGAALLALCWHDLGETNTRRASTFAQQLRAYPTLLGAPRYWAFALCTAFSTSAFYAFISGAPLVAASVLDLSPATLGLCLGSITGGFFVGSLLSGRYAGRAALITMMLAGRLTACAGLATGLVLVLAGQVSVATVFGATLFVGIGNGLTMPSSNVGAMSVHPGLAGSAAGLTGALTIGGGALVTALTGAVLPATNPAPVLLAIMLTCAAAGLAAVLILRRLDRQQATNG